MKGFYWIATLYIYSACGFLERQREESARSPEAPNEPESFADRCPFEGSDVNANNESTLYAVTGNRRDSFRAAVLITLSTGHTCSGILVSSNRILTAAHCFEKGARLNNIEFKDMQSTQAINIGAAMTVLHPDFMAALERGQSLEANPELAAVDIAVVRLHEVILSRPPVNFATDDHLPQGKLVSLIGFGDAGRGSGIGRFSQSHVGRRIEDEVIDGVHFKNMLLLNSKSGTGACPGDSGAGLFIKDGNHYALLGIVSGVNDVLYPKFPILTCKRCPQGLGIITLLSGHTEFLLKNGISGTIE
jgi:hypothetical protein